MVRARRFLHVEGSGRPHVEGDTKSSGTIDIGADVDLVAAAKAGWAQWFNTVRIHGSIHDLPPIELEYLDHSPHRLSDLPYGLVTLYGVEIRALLEGYETYWVRILPSFGPAP